ncbi:MAG: tetratricopeptide repeat protein [bacterium]|nr:tetratricopeptide repeat protein [bacterium]
MPIKIIGFVLYLLLINISFALDPSSLYNQATEAFLNRNYDQACNLYERYLAFFPNEERALEAKYYKAECLYKLGKPDQAIPYYRKVSISSPGTELARKAQNRIGDCYEKQDKLVQAIKAYQEVVTKYPDTPEAQYAAYCILWCRSLGKLEEKPLQEKKEIITPPKKGESTERAQINLAKSLFDAKEYEKARLEFHNFFRLFPKSEFLPYCQLKIAECWYYQGMYKEAVEAYSKVLNEYPNSDYIDYAQYSLAFCYYHLKDYQSALSNLRRLIDEYPESNYIESAKRAILKIEKEISKQKEREILEIAKRYYEQGDLQHAIEEFQKVPKESTFYQFAEDAIGKIKKEVAEQLFNQGNRYYNEGKLERALQSFQRLTSEYKDTPFYEKARQLEQRLMDLINKRAKEEYNKAEELYIKQEYNEALPLFRKVIADFPGSPYAELAEDAIQKIVATFINQEAKQIFDKASRFYENGNFDLARSEFERIISDYPTSKYRDEARDKISKILTMKENEQADSLYNQAISHIEKKEYEKAIEVLEKIILTFPHSDYITLSNERINEAKNKLLDERAKIQYDIGERYYKLGDYKRAIIEFKQVKERYPGSSYVSQAENGIKKASSHILEKDAERLYQKGMDYYKQEDFDMARNQFQILLAQFPESRYAEAAKEVLKGIYEHIESKEAGDIYKKGKSLQDMKDYRKALHYYDEILKEYPESEFASKAQYAKGECFYAVSDYLRAKVEWEKCIENFPNSPILPDTLYHLGDVYVILGEWKKARDTYSTLIRDYPDSPYAKGELAELINERIKYVGTK